MGTPGAVLPGPVQTSEESKQESGQQVQHKCKRKHWSKPVKCTICCVAACPSGNRPRHCPWTCCQQCRKVIAACRGDMIAEGLEDYFHEETQTEAGLRNLILMYQMGCKRQEQRKCKGKRKRWSEPVKCNICCVAACPSGNRPRHCPWTCCQQCRKDVAACREDMIRGGVAHLFCKWTQTEAGLRKLICTYQRVHYGPGQMGAQGPQGNTQDRTDWWSHASSSLCARKRSGAPLPALKGSGVLPPAVSSSTAEGSVNASLHPRPAPVLASGGEKDVQHVHATKKIKLLLERTPATRQSNSVCPVRLSNSVVASMHALPSTLGEGERKTKQTLQEGVRTRRETKDTLPVGSGS